MTKTFLKRIIVVVTLLERSSHEMKKLLAVLIAAIAATIGCFSLTGCKKEENTLIVYTEAGFAPFEFKEKGKRDVIGVDIEIAKYIANKYGYKLKIVDGNFDTIIAGIKEDNALGIAGISWTASRAENVEFSKFYFGGTFQTVIYMKSSNPALNEDGVFLKSNFNGKDVVYQSGTTGNSLVNENKTAWGVKTVKGFAEYAFALEYLKTSPSTYLVLDSYVAAQFCAQNNDIAYATIEDVAAESYGIVAKKGNSKLIEKVNGCIDELLQEDENGKTQIDKWYDKFSVIEPEE